MRKRIVLLLVIVMTFALVGCGGEEENVSELSSEQLLLNLTEKVKGIGVDDEYANQIATNLMDVGITKVKDFELSSGDSINGLCRYSTTANDITVKDLELCFEKGEMYAIKIKGYDLYTKDSGVLKQITDITFYTDKEKKENPYLVDDENITFDELYLASKDENPLVMGEKYVGNRYKVSGKVNKITNKGLANLTGGATLTLERKVGNTIVIFWAEFEREETEKLKQIRAGDTITFVGTCYGGDWEDCVLVIE